MLLPLKRVAKAHQNHRTASAEQWVVAVLVVSNSAVGACLALAAAARGFGPRGKGAGGARKRK